MQCPKCSFEHPGHHTECLNCGIIFSKYRQIQESNSSPESSPAHTEHSQGASETIKALLFDVPPETNPFIFTGRTIFFVVMVIWGMKFICTPLESGYVFRSFWHLVNLPFHEFGHIVFRPFGRLMTSMGGSIAQVLMPLICLTVFLIKTRDAFAASFALWWAGQNFMDLAPYINDARSLTLPLLGGNTGRTSPYGFHDWEFILRQTSLLRYDHVLAGLSYTAGKMLMGCALAWGGYILIKQYRNLDLRR